MSIDDALDRLVTGARGRGTLVALDFDGTLAPLRDDPEASRPLPQAAAALDRLAEVEGVHLALVSGRGLTDLADKAGPPDGTHLVGSHGAERGRWCDGELRRSELTLTPGVSDRLAELTERVRDAVRGTTARVETKPASVVLHTRTAEPADAERLTALAVELGEQPGVDAMAGKDVVELAVLRVTKGDALAALRGELAVQALAYVGDDVTDERAFATLGTDDVTIKVGPGETAARLRVADPAAVAALLSRLADLLRR